MPEPTPDLNVDSAGNIKDERTGLFLPSHIVASPTRQKTIDQAPEALRQYLEQKGMFDHMLYSGFYQGGYALHRDEMTLVVHIPQKGLDRSELLLSALASGEVNNVGATPVPYPQLPGLLRKQQVQAQTIDIDLTGRETPVKNARNAIARFNDSPLGVTQAISDMVYNLRVFNRGCPLLTVPATFDMSVWPENGLDAIPILRDGESESDAKLFYLSADWSKIKTPVPYITDPLRFRPSGLTEWPYWFRAQDGRSSKWVLLHNTQVIPIVPGNSLRPNSLIGTSSVWICLGFLAEEFLVIEERTERKLATATNGILGISGVSQTGKKIEEQIETQSEIRKLEGKFFASDYTILTSQNSKVTFTFLPLRQQDGVEPKDRKESDEDILTLAFQEPLTAVVSRGGIGFSSNAPEQGRQNADAGVGALLTVLEIALGTIYPRVTVSISRQNDPAQRLNVSTLKDFSSAVKDLNAAVEGDEPVLSREEIRALIDRDLFELPDIDDDTVNAKGTNDSDGEVREANDGDESNDRSGSDGDQESEEMRRLFASVDIMLAVAIRNFDPITPEGSDSPIPQGTPDPQAVELETFNTDMPDYDGMLDAEVLETDEPPDQDTTQPENESWTWLTLAILYFNLNSTRQVDDGQARVVRDDLSDVREQQSDGLASALASGGTVQSWVTSLQGVTERSFVHAFMLGRGGRNAMDAEDFAWLNDRLELAFIEIEDLGESIAQGLYSEAQIANYSRNIVGGMTSAYEAGRTKAFGLPLNALPEYPGDGQQICLGNCRCHWAHNRIFDANGNLIRIESTWTLDARAQHCTSCLDNSVNYAPFIVEVA